MKQIFKQTQLYNFLKYCEDNELDNIVLDCGAGGDQPPLYLFYRQGYETYGIDIDEEQIRKANDFERNNDLNLNISEGDMRKLPFEDNSISYVYSYNSIFHMVKKDIYTSLKEMKRVLKVDGLLYVNLLSNDDFQYGVGRELEEGEFLQEECGGRVVHSYFREDEADKHFEDMKVLFKQLRTSERYFGDEKVKQGYIDYICRK